MTAPSTATQEEMRRHNLSGLLTLLHVNGPTSRAELTARTGLNRSTVKALARELAEFGLAHESSPVASGGAGRPSIVVEPATDGVYVLAIDIGAEHLVAARVGLGGRVLDRCESGAARTGYGVEETLTHVKTLVTALRRMAPSTARCVGIGVSVCGLVSRASGVVRFAPNLGWVDVPLGDLLTARLCVGPSTPAPVGRAVAVGNDGDLGAMAEYLRGAGAGTDNLVYLSGEVGIGGGIILGGRALVGAGGYAGEFGHMSINPRGRMCRCGRRGCWETEVGEEAVLRETGSAPGTSLAELVVAYTAGEPAVRKGLRKVGFWLGAGVADLVNIFNPDVVIFGGATRQLFEVTEPVVRAAVDTALSAPNEHVRLALPGLGADSTLLGAAELAFAPLLHNPLAA